MFAPAWKFLCQRSNTETQWRTWDYIREKLLVKSLLFSLDRLWCQLLFLQCTRDQLTSWTVFVQWSLHQCPNRGDARFVGFKQECRKRQPKLTSCLCPKLQLTTASLQSLNRKCKTSMERQNCSGHQRWCTAITQVITQEAMICFIITHPTFIRDLSNSSDIHFWIQTSFRHVEYEGCTEKPRTVKLCILEGRTSYRHYRCSRFIEVVLTLVIQDATTFAQRYPQLKSRSQNN